MEFTVKQIFNTVNIIVIYFNSGLHFSGTILLQLTNLVTAGALAVTMYTNPKSDWVFSFLNDLVFHFKLHIVLIKVDNIVGYISNTEFHRETKVSLITYAIEYIGM